MRSVRVSSQLLVSVAIPTNTENFKFFLYLYHLAQYIIHQNKSLVDLINTYEQL